MSREPSNHRMHGHVEILSVGRDIIGVEVKSLYAARDHCDGYHSIVCCVRSIFESTVPKLKTFQSEICLSLSGCFFMQLAHKCPNIEVLNIPYVTDSGPGVIALAQHCHQLHTISLQSQNITDASIQALCDNCPHLRNIDISRCYNLTDASMMAIANAYPNLESIDIKYCRFSDESLILCANKCRELRSVSLGGFANITTSRSLNALWTTNPNLTDIDIGGIKFVSDDDIMLILQCCPQLRKLNIASSLVTNAGVIAVAEHCPQLRSLNITGCYSVSNAALVAVAENCPQLNSLHMSYCRNISDATLIALGQHCHELKLIDITDNKNITDVGITTLALGCPLLQKFFVRRTNISYESVITVVTECSQLQVFSLSSCYNISDEFLYQLQNDLPSIVMSGL